MSSTKTPTTESQATPVTPPGDDAPGGAAGKPSPFATIDEALADIRAGRMVVVCDDEDRENEGDLTMAAQFVTPETINFMATHGRGLICLALTPRRCDELNLGPMVTQNSARFQTAFTQSIEAREGVSTGISAADRAHTIQVAVDPECGPQDIVQPGHVFPLIAQPGGVLERTGQTEAGVDLARLAGLQPAAVICEVMNDDGTMARVPDLIEYCRRHGLKMITVADLIRHRRRTEKLVRRVAVVQHADPLRRVSRHRLRVADRRLAPRRPGQGQRRRQARRARAGPLRVPDGRRLRLAALRLRRAAGARPAAHRGGRPGRRALHAPGGPRHRPARTSSGPTPCRRRAATRSKPTSSSASRPTCATTGSAPRSWSISACRASAR